MDIDSIALESVIPCLTLRLCNPRGFCAGVDRAIQIVLLALKKYGPPVYVRHEIVHNRYVVEGLQHRGAIFVEELEEIPAQYRCQPVIFSAHGVPKTVSEKAQSYNLFYFDATCPLVSKVHKQALRHNRLGRHVILIGHSGHPEVVGTMGQLPIGTVTLIETLEHVKKFQPKDPQKLGFVSQTTLSVEDTIDIVDALQKRFPLIEAPAAESICYATTNRQQAVQYAAKDCDLFLIVGAPNSSNSRRLVEVAERSGAREALLVQCAKDIPWQKIEEHERNNRSPKRKKEIIIGLSAGASAPDILVDEIIETFQKRYKINLEFAQTAIENETFLVNKELRDIKLEDEDMAFLKGKKKCSWS